ncbi:MAG TPA: PAS domain S-box protein [Opitutaceae bacterium]|nr:PAS domain S-box protein [Opitutaceae bacterium]
MKTSTWTTLVASYRAALSTYAASGEEQHLQAAYELGREALSLGLGVLDMARLHQEALLAVVASTIAPVATVRLAKAVETFLMEALSPFEAAHRGFRDACDRLRLLNETLKERNAQLALANVRLEEEIVGRRAAQEAAEDSELKFRSVVESARDGIVTIDAAGHIVALNHGAEAMFGYRRAELIGRTFTRLLPSRWRVSARYRLRRLVAGSGEGLLRHSLEARVRHRDGTEFPVELCLATWRTRERVFFTGIVRDIRERKQAELALRESREHYMKLFTEARTMQENLRLLSNQVLTVQEEERKHISRELHDEIGQTLTAANVSIALLRKHAHADAEFARKVETAQRLLEQSMDMVHRFARELRPSMLDHLGPFAALQNYVNAFVERTGIAVELENRADLERLDLQQGTVLYRIAQESLTNVFKHAQATRVAIRLDTRDAAVCMEICDNGRGTSGSAVSSAPGRQRLGLLGMQERVRLVNGHFTLESAPRRGTTVRVLIPFPPKLPMGRGTPSHPTTEPRGSSYHTSHEQDQCVAR